MVVLDGKFEPRTENRMHATAGFPSDCVNMQSSFIYAYLAGRGQCWPHYAPPLPVAPSNWLQYPSSDLNNVCFSTVLPMCNRLVAHDDRVPVLLYRGDRGAVSEHKPPVQSPALHHQSARRRSESNHSVGGFQLHCSTPKKRWGIYWDVDEVGDASALTVWLLNHFNLHLNYTITTAEIFFSKLFDYSDGLTSLKILSVSIEIYSKKAFFWIFWFDTFEKRDFWIFKCRWKLFEVFND